MLRLWGPIWIKLGLWKKWTLGSILFCSSIEIITQQPLFLSCHFSLLFSLQEILSTAHSHFQPWTSFQPIRVGIHTRKLWNIFMIYESFFSSISWRRQGSITPEEIYFLPPFLKIQPKTVKLNPSFPFLELCPIMPPKTRDKRIPSYKNFD